MSHRFTHRDLTETPRPRHTLSAGGSGPLGAGCRGETQEAPARGAYGNSSVCGSRHQDHNRSQRASHRIPILRCHGDQQRPRSRVQARHHRGHAAALDVLLRDRHWRGVRLRAARRDMHTAHEHGTFDLREGVDKRRDLGDDLDGLQTRILFSWAGVLRFGLRDLEHARSQHGQQHGRGLRPRGLTRARRSARSALPGSMTGQGRRAANLEAARPARAKQRATRELWAPCSSPQTRTPRMADGSVRPLLER
jgi:hypothetical protein